MKIRFEVNRRIYTYDSALSTADNAGIAAVTSCTVDEFDNIKLDVNRCLNFLARDYVHDIELEDWGDCFFVTGHFDDDVLAMIQEMLDEYMNSAVHKIDYDTFYIPDDFTEFNELEEV